LNANVILGDLNEEPMGTTSGMAESHPFHDSQYKHVPPQRIDHIFLRGGDSVEDVYTFGLYDRYPLLSAAATATTMGCVTENEDVCKDRDEHRD
jgi:hypothetical protein